MQIEHTDVEIANVKPSMNSELEGVESHIEGPPKRTLTDPSLKKLDVLYVGLPESIYTCAIIMPLCENLAEGYWQNLFIILQVYVSHIVNFGIQAVVIAYVYVIYKDSEEELGFCGSFQTTSVVRYLCVVIYIGYCIRDIAQTIKMGLFVYQFPSTQKFEYLRFTERELAIYDADEGGQYGSGMTKCRKFMCCVFVLLPKFGLSSALMVYGTGFVVVCEGDADLILNALALGFIFDIDEIMYEYLLTSQQQDLMESLPKIEVKMNTALKYMKEFGMIAKALLLLAISRFCYGQFCIYD